MPERRRKDRKDFSYYMRLTDVDTGDLVGHLVDISTAGFKLDSQKALPIEKVYRFHLDLTSEVATKPFMVFKARSKWCQIDPLDPFVYNVGFELVEIAGELGIEVQGAHNALMDAFMTAQVFQRLLPRLQALGIKSLGDMLRVGHPNRKIQPRGGMI